MLDLIMYCLCQPALRACSLQLLLQSTRMPRPRLRSLRSPSLRVTQQPAQQA